MVYLKCLLVVFVLELFPMYGLGTEITNFVPGW